jgi:hypothetical protein
MGFVLLTATSRTEPAWTNTEFRREVIYGRATYCTVRARERCGDARANIFEGFCHQFSSSHRFNQIRVF